MKFLVSADRFMSFANTAASNKFHLFVFIPTFSTLYFFSVILDIAVLFDRIGVLCNNRKPKISPYWLCFILFAGCLILNAPYFFVLSPHGFYARDVDGSLRYLYAMKQSE